MKPLLVTMGDAAGIGPEIIVRAFERGELRDAVVVGDPAVLRRAGAPMTAVIEHPADASAVPPGCLPVLAPPGLPAGLADTALGSRRRTLRRRRRALHRTRRDAGAGRRGRGDRHRADPQGGAGRGRRAYPGHTEMLQALAAEPGAAPPPVRMMLANDELRVVLVTIHLSLRRAIDAVTFDAVLQTLRIAHRAAAAWGQPRPRIAVAGLNPHAGEGGLFGDEELRIIGPAVQAAAAEGIDASGPFAPDTVFMRARHAPGHPGEFDLVVAMTHDHGLIPVKYLGVEQGVNVTLGLPFVRTSPDHGTAFDIAGRGTRRPGQPDRRAAHGAAAGARVGAVQAATALLSAASCRRARAVARSIR